MNDTDDLPGDVYGEAERLGGIRHGNGHDPSAEARPLHRRSVRRAARGLGWFSLGLGLAGLLLPRAVARAGGMAGHESLVRACGLREVATGLGLLLARDPTPWLWARVAGDAADLAALGAHVARGHPRSAHAALALAAVAGITAVDALSARAARHDRLPPAHDYSDRRGLPLPPDEMRGAAMVDFDAPEDLQIPLPLRPQLH